MLKVIAEDFIKTECVDTVLPLYRELIAATKRQPLCIAYDLYRDEKDPGHFISLKSGLTILHFMRTAPASISLG
ncbi:hypothetical protein SB6417_00031 [Klebsiella pasteurii]|nr:hypothetical protein SB6417_00031 [Klebsiella pasteurii]